ncbi:MAG: L,D-transpeptidase family protein [Bacteroidales bacterium]|nr:L,D-transpeptidase family protein [Bacteroidales bacterium]
MKLIIAAICFMSMMIGRDNKTVEELSTLPKEVKQVILVQDHKLSLWNRTDGEECGCDDFSGWEMAFEVPCHYGKNGLSADRHDGDGTTPIGLFKVLYCFGNAPDPGAGMTYREVQRTSYWSGEKEDYNTWVDLEPGSREMKRSEYLYKFKISYKYAMAIDFNTNPVVWGKGFAIFIHCDYLDDQTTAGCVAIEEKYMLRLVKECKDGTYLWVRQ